MHSIEPPASQSESESEPLIPVELEIIRFFVQIVGALGVPRSVGEIFGVLFCATQPQPFEAIVDKLGISKGSVSQGLKFLVKIGAAAIVYVPRDRRTYYEAETSMRRLVSGALRESVQPHLEGNGQFIDSIRAQLKAARQTTPELADHLERRVETLGVWNEKFLQLLPWLERLASLKVPDIFSTRENSGPDSQEK